MNYYKMNVALILCMLVFSLTNMNGNATNFTDKDVTSIDQTKAIEAIDYFKSQKNSEVVTKGLESSNPKIQLAAIGALKEIGDKAVTPEIINNLEKNNYVEDGSENATIHRILKVKLIDLINSLLGSKFSANNPNNTDEVKELIVKMRQLTNK